MNLTVEMIPALYFSGMISGFILSFFWIKKIRTKQREINPSGGTYSTAQKISIIGIILFLFPISISVIVNLVRGTFFLLISIFDLIQMPSIITSVVMNFLYPFAGLLLAITGAYYFCSIIWPIKRANA